MEALSLAALMAALMSVGGDEQKPERYLIGQVHNYDPDATSAFEMEIRGLETAVKVFRAYCDAVV